MIQELNNDNELKEEFLKFLKSKVDAAIEKEQLAKLEFEKYIKLIQLTDKEIVPEIQVTKDESSFKNKNDYDKFFPKNLNDREDKLKYHKIDNSYDRMTVTFPINIEEEIVPEIQVTKNESYKDKMAIIYSPWNPILPDITDVPQVEKNKIDNKFLNVKLQKILNDCNKFISMKILLDRVHNFKTLENVEVSDIENIINNSIKSIEKVYKRLMIGKDNYLYGLYNTKIPNQNILFYNPDAEGQGNHMFSNMKRVILKCAAEFDRPFTLNEILSKITNEVFFIKNTHQAYLRHAVSNSIVHISKVKGSKINTAGSHNKRIFEFVK